jgi:hypothetical protein
VSLPIAVLLREEATFATGAHALDHERIEIAADLIDELYQALVKCRALVKFFVKPERCICVGDDVYSAQEAFSEASASLAKAHSAADAQNG